MRTGLFLLVAAALCFDALVSGGRWSVRGPASLLGKMGLIGLMVCLPMALLLLVMCALRALMRPGRSDTGFLAS